jgi:sigma-B regulation protein RsbU (phosphoserine phosphatase)
VGDGGLPSGLFAGAEYDRYSVELQPGDAVLFCTDGILEARNEAGEDFGSERILELCTKHSAASPDTLLDRLFADVDAFTGEGPAHDDMTAVVLKTG